jgi:hypothetical protein
LVAEERYRQIPLGDIALGDLHYRITPELIAEIAFAHHGLHALEFGKKASTNLGTIQTAGMHLPQTSACKV